MDTPEKVEKIESHERDLMVKLTPEERQSRGIMLANAYEEMSSALADADADRAISAEERQHKLAIEEPQTEAEVLNLFNPVLLDGGLPVNTTAGCGHVTSITVEEAKAGVTPEKCAACASGPAPEEDAVRGDEAEVGPGEGGGDEGGEGE